MAGKRHGKCTVGAWTYMSKSALNVVLIRIEARATAIKKLINDMGELDVEMSEEQFEQYMWLNCEK